MMITKEQAQALPYRAELWHVFLLDSQGKPVRCKVNGPCKTWKSRPEEFKLPVKHGLANHFNITEMNAGEWSPAQE
jgi:hypothetical protein